MPAVTCWSNLDAAANATGADVGTVMSGTSTYAGIWSYFFKSSGGNSRLLISYDVSSIPAFARVTSVVGQIVLTQWSENQNINIQKATSSWVESGGAGPTTDSTVLSTIAVTTSTVDVGYAFASTAAMVAVVQGWVDGSVSNYGLCFRRTPEDFTGSFGGNNYYMREIANGYTPYITVTYVESGGHQMVI